VAIPIGVLFAGALPEPQAANPSTRTAGEAAVTDFRSRLLASLDSLVVPLQTSPTEGTVSLDGVGPATRVVGSWVSATAAEAPFPEIALRIEKAAPDSTRPGAATVVATPLVGCPLSGASPDGAAGGLAAPSVGEGAGGEPSAGKGRPQGSRRQGVAGREALLPRAGVGAGGPAPVVVAQPIGPHSHPGEAGQPAAAGLASNATDQPMPPADVSAADAASPAEAANSASGQVGLRSERQRQASRGDEVPPVGLTSGQPQAQPGAGQAGRSASEGVASTVELLEGKATQGAKPQRPERAPTSSGQPVVRDPQPANEAAAVLAVGQPALVEPAAREVTSGGGGEVSVRPLGADSPAVEQRRVVPGAIAGVGAATMAQARTSEPDPGPPEAEPRGQEADAVGTNEPVERGRRPVVGGSQVSADAVRNSLPQGREAWGQSHRADERGGGEDTRPGQGLLAQGGASQELPAEEASVPWGRRAREAAGAGREPWLGHARRFATRDQAGAPSKTAPLREPRPVLEGIGEVFARARAETPQPTFEPGGREGAVVMRLGDLEERMPRLVVEHARLAERGGWSELRVRLHPPELGEIRVVFRSEGEEIRGAVALEREEVKAWVEGEAPRWQSELSEAGLRVARLEVALLGHGGASGHGAMAWDGAESPPWGGSPQVGQVPVGASAQEAEPVEPEFGVNAAGSDGRLDYWA